MRHALSTAPLLLLAACAGGSNGGAPSLAPRPIETLDLSEPVATEAPAPPADPALAARYATIVAAAEQGDAAFAREERTVRVAVERARRAAVGSDAWVGAQQAITRLEAMRGPSEKASGDLDAERTSPAVDSVALDAAVKTVSMIDERQRGQLAGLIKILPSP